MKALHRVKLSKPIVASPLEPTYATKEMIWCLSEDGMFVKMEDKEARRRKPRWNS